MSMSHRSRSLLRLILVAAAAAPLSATGADHLDSPRVKTNHLLDINDVYVFQSPQHKDHTVIVVTVVPLAGVLAPTVFSSDGFYDIKVDNNGDAIEDITIRFSFSMPNHPGFQRFEAQWTDRHGMRVLARGLTGHPHHIPGGGAVAAGLFDDPFFFDLNAFNKFKQDLNPADFCNPGTNFFKGLNVMAIVLEVPSVWLQRNEQSTHIGLWARTEVEGEQFDRMGRPAINTALIPAPMKDAFNDGSPSTDRERFRNTVLTSLLADGNDVATANALADLLLPDLNTFDTSSAQGFPNGRRLADDVIDIEFGLILKNAGVTSDCVGNDSNFSDEFPYLAPPNPPSG
jgi:hypothetical protein